MNPPTWAKNATPPPFAEALNSPKLASMSCYKIARNSMLPRM